MARRIDVGLLGGVAVTCDDQPVPVAGTKLKAIVAMLALGAPHPVSDDRLIAELWGDDSPANPTNALQAQISNLRRLLGRDAVQRSGPGYVLTLGPDDVDAIRLERLVRAGREATAAGDDEAAARHFEAALGMVRGEPLDDLADYRFARDAASRLEELILSAHEGFMNARLDLGDHAEIVSVLTGLVRTYPLRERFHAQLILALYRCGRQADALRAYQHARTTLVEELGVDPGPELQALERAVLAQDTSLDSPAVVATGAAPPDPAESRGPTDATPPQTPANAPGKFPLTGREAEFALLVGDLDAAFGGRGRVALVGGEPGIGKTRLVEEVALTAVRQDLTVTWGKCFEGRGAPEFWPWTQVIHGVMTRADEDDVRTAVGPDAAELAQIAPEIKELVGDVDAPPPVDPESARFRLYRAVSGFLRRLARVRPLVVVLDDLHWADGSSMALIGFLAAEIDDSPIFVMGTYRNIDPMLGGALSETLVELSRRSISRDVELRGLDRNGLGHLLAADGSEPADDVVDLVLRRTQGNPFFVTELMRLLPAEGITAENPDIVGAVPASVRGLMRKRLSHLPEPTARTLAVAAALGQDFDLAVLAAAIDVDGATLLDRLEPAIDAGIVIDNPGGISRYRFTHGLANETIYGDLGPAQRGRTHHRIAETLEAHHGDSEGPHLVTTAAHWYHAVPAASPDAAIDAALRAAAWAQAHVAHRQAKEQLTAALELIADLPEGRHRSVRELQVQDQLSVLLITSTSYTDPEFGRVCERVYELSERVGDHALLAPAMFRLSLHHVMKADLSAGLELGNDLIDPEWPGNSPATEVGGHFGLGWLHHEMGDQRAALRHLELADSLCEAGHDAGLVQSVVENPAIVIKNISAVVWWLVGDNERAEEVCGRALDMALRITGRDSWSTMVTFWSSSTVSMLERDAELTMARCDEGIALARAGGYGLGVPYMGVNRGWARAALGDHENGITEMLEGAALANAFAAVYMKHTFLGMLADAYLMGGRVDEALLALDDGLAAAADTGDRWYEAELYRLRGDALANQGVDADVVLAEYLRAIEVAQRHGALGLLRRAEASVASLD